MNREKSKEGLDALIATSLKEGASSFRLRPGVAARVKAEVRSASAVARAGWYKAAAAVALAVALAVVCINRKPAEAPVEEMKVAVDPETEMLSDPAGEPVVVKAIASFSGASYKAVQGGVTEITSEPTLVFLRAETCSFWNTDDKNQMTVPVDFPKGAKTAELTVAGEQYHHTYVGITEDEFTFELPRPADATKENVYELTLRFDDSSVRTARLGLVKSVKPNSDGMVSCLAPEISKVWGLGLGKFTGLAKAENCLLIVK